MTFWPLLCTGNGLRGNVAKRKLRNGPHRPSSVSPLFTAYPDVWGIYVGDGCVTGESPLEWREVDAHAHNSTDDDWFGWICVADPAAVITDKGNLTAIIKHEIAHILCPNALHTKGWQRVVTLLGAPQEAKKYGRKPNGDSSTS